MASFLEDSWISATLGIGGTKDTKLCPERSLQAEEAMALYRNYDLARQICELPVEAGLREGWYFETGDPDATKALAMRLEALDVPSRLMEAAIWGRACGGGALLLGVADGREVAEPLGPGELVHVISLDRRNMTVKAWETDPKSPGYGEPSLYYVTMEQQKGGMQQTVHASRLILFGGDRTPRRERLANAGWDDSVLQKIQTVLESYGLGWGAASQLLVTASQAVYGVKDLAKILATENGEARLRSRFSIINLGRSIARMLVIDADGETFDLKSTQFSGVPELLDRYASRLAAAAEIPAMLLFGEEPGGQNATGDAQLETWYADRRSWQRAVVRPALARLGAIVAPGADVVLKDPDPQKDKKNADLDLVRSQSDCAYIGQGVFAPEEVAEARCGGERPYIVVDLESRKLPAGEPEPDAEPAPEETPA